MNTTTVDTSTPAEPAPTPAPAAAPEPAKPNPEDIFASKFGALSKKEREIRNKEAALKDRLSKLEKYEKDSTSWKDNPAAVLQFLEQEYGIDFAKLADHQIQSFQDTLPKSPEEQLQARIQAMEDKLKAEAEAKTKGEEEAKAKAEEDEKAKAKEYEGLLLTKITEIVDGAAEDFELIKTFSQHSAVIDTMRTNYEETGELLDVTTACQWVETYLENELAKTPKAAKLKKIFTQDETKQVDDQIDEPSTLSVDRMSSSSKPAPKTSVADPLDRDQRIRAILARNSN
jgi:hypothetical protein